MPRRSTRAARRIAALAAWLAVAAALAIAGVAVALPQLGTARPNIKLVDGWDRELDLGKFQRPMLVVYENEGSTKQNASLKKRLLELGKTKRYRDAIASVIVADVSEYDHWPAKGAAKSELRKWSSELGIVVYADWGGDVRRALGAEKGADNIFFYGREGRLLFARAGELDDDGANKLLSLLASQVNPPT